MFRSTSYGRWFLAIAAACLLGREVAALGLPVDEMRGMDLVGEARMRVMFWNVYDARLFAPQGDWSAQKPFALSLTYLRKFRGDRIARRSIVEIRGQGFDDEQTLARWQTQLTAILPDVEAQDEIVGVADEQGHTRFFLDGEPIGDIPDPRFTRAFFAIWLDERTSEPELRAQLLGDAS